MYYKKEYTLLTFPEVAIKETVDKFWLVLHCVYYILYHLYTEICVVSNLNEWYSNLLYYSILASSKQKIQYLFKSIN